MAQKDFIQFSINGQLHKVAGEQTSPHAKLVDFIRDEAQLKGTKYLCRQGGCGACVVSVTHKDPVSGHPTTLSVNSCLTPVLSCDGWDVSTVEDLGDRQKGYDPVQKRLAQFAGTQCGFCTPGMIMTMKSLMENKGDKLKMEDVEGALDGNICRCTGYRPILDAFKSFACDAPFQLKQKCMDIEDCLQCPCPTNKTQRDKCCKSSLPSDLSVVPLSGGKHWVKVHSLQSLYDQLGHTLKRGDEYRLVAGNTGIGIFKAALEEDTSPQVFLDISSIPDLLRASYNAQEIVLGAGLSISGAIATLKSAAEVHGDFHYAKTIVSHFQNRVGNVHIRNVGTLGGNLMLKHDHPEFASDIWLLLEAVGTKVKIGCSTSHQSKLFTMQEMLDKDLRGKVILSFHLPPLSSDFFLRSFKVSPRYQNSKGYVNAAFLFRVLPSQNFRVLQKPTILFGGLGLYFNKAIKTEEFLNGKSLHDTNAVKEALKVLEDEMQVPRVSNGLSGSVEYRKALAKSFLYKVVLSIVGKECDPAVTLGGNSLTRGIRTGHQSYVKNKQSKDILYKGFPKLEAVVQCSGEAEYTNDIPKAVGELFGAFVLSTVANATLDKVDTSSAMGIPGVVRFIGAEDIPGPNNYMVWESTPEPVFVSSKVEHAGQPIGLILAKSRDAAFLGASKVKVTYKDVSKPILSIDESLEKAKKEGKLEQLFVRALKSAKGESGKTPKHVIKGEFRIGGQHHFQMEPHSTLCIPTEDGFQVFSATQWIDKTQAVISSVLKIPVNNIQVQVRRLGGGFGGKATRSAQTAAACAVASYVTNKPVRVTLDLETHMRTTGKKLPYFISYDVGFDDAGKIIRLDAEVVCDPGFSPNEETSYLFAMNVQNCYETDEGWNVRISRALTNTPANTFCRAPGHLQGAATIEYIMEHIAFALQRDPWEVRMANMMQKGSGILASPGNVLETENPLGLLINDFKKETDYAKRSGQVEDFNKKNRWAKRGLGLVPVRFANHFIAQKYSVVVGIHHIDGSVVVCHGGIEMGQGINTKVAQTVASFLEIPLEKVRVRPTSNLATPNSSLTAAGTTSESCCFAAKEACRILREKMEPVRKTLENASWEKLVTECNKKSIDLTSSFMNQSVKDNVKGYDVNSLCLTEVEIDVLTGEYQILRLDCTLDGTQSLNPEVDLGQVEGGLVFGLGIWTTERLEYDTTSGQLLTANAWDYKPPMTKDIPQDFRVTLYSDSQPNQNGVLGSKSAGEPSLCSGVAVLLALRNAISAARRDAGNNEWFQLNGPVTPQDVLSLCLTSESQFRV